MEPISRIIITGDFLRLNKLGISNQQGNIRWLSNLISPVLRLVSDIPIITIYQSELCNKLYNLNDLPQTVDSWAKLFNKYPTTRELAEVHQYFSNSLVIGFELPEILKYGFDILEIHYIDFTIHPIRFLDDLIFGVRSNIKGIDKVLTPYMVHEEEFYIVAGLAMASVGRLKRLKFLEEEDNIALFAGQTSDDKVLIKGGKFIDDKVFIDSFAEMSHRHSKILVKPHPYAKENKAILMLTRLFPNTQIVEDNFYYLLSHESISTVYSITSSTSIEAAYFGKIGVHLSDYPYFFSDKTALGGAFLSIKPELYLPQFWSGILKTIGIECNSFHAICVPTQKNRMRDSLRNYWGADIFEFKI